jgi:hypothetical protein
MYGYYLKTIDVGTFDITSVWENGNQACQSESSAHDVQDH